MNFTILMKRICFVLYFLLSFTSLNAQDFYLALGANISYEDHGMSNNSYFEIEDIYQLGFQVGSAMELKLNQTVSFFPQAYFTMKRNKSILNVNIDDQIKSKMESSLNQFSMDVPLHMKVNFNIEKTNLFVLMGPYFNFFLFDVNELIMDGNKVEGDLFEMNYWSKIDYGLNIGFGAHINRYLVMLSYDHGFSRKIKVENPISNEELETTIYPLNSFKLTVAYKLKS